MLTLAIESSSPRGSVALLRNGALLHELTHEAPNAHAEVLLTLVERVLAEASVPRHALERVVAGIGPGSFTGLRVGIALAQGIALGLGIQAIGAPSLASIAYAVAKHRGPSDGQLFGALTDARRGELFFAAYDAQGAEVISPRLLPKDSITERVRSLLGGRTLSVGGDASQLLAEELRSPAPSARWPLASSAAAVADGPLASSSLVPLYLRGADAKLPALPPNPLSA